MSEMRMVIYILGLASTALALAWTGDWLFDHRAQAITAPQAYEAGAVAFLWWLGYFGWRQR